MARTKKSAPIAKAIGFAPGDAGATLPQFGKNTSLPEADVYYLLYTKHPIVNAVVNIIAHAVASDGYSLQHGDDDDADRIEPRASVSLQVRQFLTEAWPPQAAVRTWRRAQFSVASEILWAGHAYWRKKRVRKTVVGLERLDPRLVKPVPNQDRTAIEYFKLKKYREFGSGITAQTSDEQIAANDMIFFCRGGGDTLLGQPSTLEAIDLTLSVDLSYRKFRDAFFRNGATAGTILINKSSNDDQVKAAEALLTRAKARSENAYKVWMLTGDWEVVKNNVAGKAEADFLKGSELNREEIAMAYHVPLGKLMTVGSGLSSGNSQGKEQDDATFQENAVLPLEEAIYETISDQLLKDEFDLGDIRMTPRRRQRIRAENIGAASDMLNMGGTINEARALVNLPTMDAKDFPDLDLDTPVVIAARGMGIEQDMPRKDSQPANGPNDKLDASNKKTKNGVGQKAAKTFPNPHPFRKRVQRVIGRLHARLSDLVLPHVAATKKASTPDQWDALWSAVTDAIEQGYGEAADVARDALKAYGIEITDRISRGQDAAVQKALEKATTYVRANLAMYVNEQNDAVNAQTITAQEAASAVDSRLELYAEPAWNVFEHVKGEAYEYQSGLLLDWTLDPASQHCEDCPDVADGSPYTTSTGDNPIPDWPGDDGQACGIRCNCSVTPEEESWRDTMAPIEEQAARDAEELTANFR
jgi:phage portal protein BeeE